MKNKSMDYNSINFKNKDVDRFATKFGKDTDPPYGYQNQTTIGEQVSNAGKSGARSMSNAYLNAVSNKMQNMTEQEKMKLANQTAKKTAAKIYESDGGNENPNFYSFRQSALRSAGLPTDVQYMEEQAKSAYKQVMDLPNRNKPKR